MIARLSGILKECYHCSDRLLLHLKRAFRAIVYLFNLQTLLLLTAACLAVWVSAQNGWAFDMEFTIISTGTIFPLTFALAQAYTRREHATSLIADLKASVVGLYWMHRDWDQSNGFPASIGNDFLPNAVHAKAVLVQLLLSIRRYLMSTSSFESMAEVRLQALRHEFLAIFDHNVRLFQKTKAFRHSVEELLQGDEGQQHLADIYKRLSQISVLNEKLCLATGYTKGGEGGFSRTSQYLRYLISSVENLRVIKEYRTPAMMRHASGVLLHVFAIILAPYFVHFCSEEAEGGCAAAYVSASSYVMIVMLLYHVHQDLENCFTVSGLDDALFLVAEEVDALTGATVLQRTASECTCVQGASPMGGSPRGESPPARASSPACCHTAHSFDLPGTALTNDKRSLRPILESVAASGHEQQYDVEADYQARAPLAAGYASGYDGRECPSLAAIFTRSAHKHSTGSPSSHWRQSSGGTVTSMPDIRPASPDASLPRLESMSGTVGSLAATLPAAPAAVAIVRENEAREEGYKAHLQPSDMSVRMHLPLPPTAFGVHTEDSPFAIRPP